MRYRPILRMALTGLLLLTAHRAGASVENDSPVEEKIRELASAKVKQLCEDCRVSVKCKWIAPAVAKVSPELITALQFDAPGLPAGYVTGKVLLGNTTATAQTAVQLHISVHQKLPVARKQFSRGEAITSANIAWQWKDISSFKRSPITDIEQFAGQHAGRVIRKNSVFFASDLAGPQTIQPGDPVAMDYGENGVRIQINCVAREAKGVGQEIRLYSKETRRNYIAKIITKKKIVWVRTL